jgi:hypothetical protein
MGDYEEEIFSNLERAETNLQVAQELLAKGYYDVSASSLPNTMTTKPANGRVSDLTGDLTQSCSKAV